MAELILLPPTTCVINRLCTDLAALDRQTLACSAAILPTRRLVTLCLAALAEKHLAYEPPLATTLDGFVRRLCANEQPVIDEIHVEQVLTMLLTTKKFKYLHPNFVHEIRQFFNDIIAHDLQACFHQRIEEQLANNPWLAEGEIAQQRAKYAELQQLFLALQTQLQHDHHTTSSLAQQQNIARASAVLPQHDFKHIFVAAFTSVNKTAADFLQKIAACPPAVFYFNQTAINHPINPVNELLTTLQKEKTIQVKTEPAVSNTQHTAASINIVNFTSPQIELSHALHHAQQLLHTGQVRAAEIAIVLSSDRFYLPHLLAVVDLFAFPKNIAVPIPLRLTSSGGFLQALSSYVLDEFQVPAAIDVVTHPLFAAQDLPRASIANTLSEVHRRGHGSLRLRLAADSPAAEAVARIDAIVQRFRPAPLQQQLQQLQELLRELKFFQLMARGNFELQSVENIYVFLQNLAASSLSSTRYSTQEFWQFVADKLLALPLRKVGEPLAGVQILSLPEVRAMPFQHIIVLGCNEGFFPKALPRDVVVSDKLKSAIGLNSWQHLEAMEDITFNALFHRHCQLTLSYCSSVAERSRFIEKIVRTHALTTHDGTSLALQDILPAASLSPVTHDNVPDFASQNFLRKVSASSAESFIRCPLRHLLHKLDVAATASEIRDSSTPLEEGDRLHKVIEAFNQSPVYQQICRAERDDAERIAQLTALLNDLTATHASALLSDSAFATHLRLFAWPRFAAFVSRKTAVPAYDEFNEHEISWTDQPSWLSDSVCELHCKIDHIQQAHDHVLLLDYKRKSLPPSNELDAAIAMQLAFYAYAFDCEQRARHKQSLLANTITGYYSVMEGEFTLVACGADVGLDFVRQRYGLRQQKTRSLEALVQQMHDLLTFRYQHVQQPAQHIAADPSFCGGCQFDDFCRKNDPAQREAIAQQNFLATHLADLEHSNDDRR